MPFGQIDSFAPDFSFNAPPTPTTTLIGLNGGAAFNAISGGDVPTSMPHQQLMTPEETTGGMAAACDVAPEKDPFLSLLEQLAETEQGRGGPSELDFLLGGGGAAAS